MLISKEDGTITLVNSRTEELFGWPRDLLLGRQLTMLVPIGVVSDACRASSYGVAVATAPPSRSDLTFGPLQTEDGLLITTVVRDISNTSRYCLLPPEMLLC